MSRSKYRYRDTVPQLVMDVERSRLMLRKPRLFRLEAVRRYAGENYSEETSKTMPRPLNGIALYVSIVARSLIAKNPRVLLTSPDRSSRPTISAMKTWINEELERMNFANQMQRIVVDSQFFAGFRKIALGTVEDSARYSWKVKAGAPFFERIDLDDIAYDPHARDFEEVSWVGHRYRAPLEVVKEDKTLNVNRKDVTASTDPAFNNQGDERINMLGRTYYTTNWDEYEPMADLWEIYLPRHKVVLTLQDSGQPGAGILPIILREQGWIGPDSGPYDMLGMGTVPGNVLPKAPIQDITFLDEQINVMMNKLLIQAVNQKEIVVTSNPEGTAKQQAASDGDIVTGNPKESQAIEYRGPSAKVYQLLEACRQMFSYMSGNLELMGGLSPQSKTATQDKMLEANSSRTIVDMQDRVVGFTAKALKDLCWYWHHDPVKVMKTTYQVPGFNQYSVVRKVTPEQRGQIPFEDLQIRFNPYSLQYQTPQEMLQKLFGVVDKLTPMMPMLQQRGQMFNVQEFLNKVAEFGDFYDVLDLFSVEPPPQDKTIAGGTGQAEAPGMPASTNRTYTRENVSSQTNASAAKENVANMLGQESEE